MSNNGNQYKELHRLEKMYEDAFTSPPDQSERNAVLGAIEKDVWREMDRLEAKGLKPKLGEGKGAKL